MDRGAPPIRFLIAGAALLLAGAALSAPRDGLQALVWTAPGSERAVLLSQPAACLAPDIDAATIAYGRALFNAPQLLGGQAARAGISCASCHANGRRSDAFFLDGVSAAPGTADVSASFFNLARANHRFDPKPIPDLALPGKVSRGRTDRALEQFTRGLIVEEFAGREPAPVELAAVADYVRAMRPCTGEGGQPKRLARDLQLLSDSIEAAARRAEAGDSAGSRLLVSAARFRLGLVEERYPSRRFADDRKRLLAASRALQPRGASDLSGSDLRAWLKHFERNTMPRLVRGEPRSLYSEAQVDRWLTRK